MRKNECFNIRKRIRDMGQEAHDIQKKFVLPMPMTCEILYMNMMEDPSSRFAKFGTTVLHGTTSFSELDELPRHVGSSVKEATRTPST